MNEKSLLSVNNLSVILDDRPILENVSFDLSTGENLAVIGPNGSGKTVLLKALLKTVPFKGQIQWAPGVRIGYVPQKIDADRHLPLTFRNLLLAKSQILKLEKNEMEHAIESTGLETNILDIPAGHLSGGQFQRGLIAFALLGRPNLILFDEPTASIDQPGEEKIYSLIHRLQEEYSATAIVVSHDLTFVYRYANKVLCLNKQNICFGAPEEALTPENLRKLYGEDSMFYHHTH